MFKSICIIPNNGTFPTDIGFIAETLLYYERVNLIITHDSILTLLQNCEFSDLKDLVDNGSLKLYMRNNHFGTVSRKQPNGKVTYDVANYVFSNIPMERIVFQTIFKYTNKRRGYSHRLTNKFLEIIEPIEYENDLREKVFEDLDDFEYVKSALQIIINSYNPNFQINKCLLNYRKEMGYDGWLNFTTNINFENLNNVLPKGVKLDESHIINEIQNARADLHFAANLNSELATSAIQEHLVSIKFSNIFSKSEKSRDELMNFNKFILNDSFAIREAINSKEKSFNDFMSILHKASKYKAWLSKVEEDKNLIKEYHEAVTQDTWIEKLPAKSVRWSIFTGLGILIDSIGGGGLGTLTGLGLSAGDAFLLDNILKGWKPNIFIKNELKNFTQ